MNFPPNNPLIPSSSTMIQQSRSPEQQRPTLPSFQSLFGRLIEQATLESLQTRTERALPFSLLPIPPIQQTQSMQSAHPRQSEQQSTAPTTTNQVAQSLFTIARTDEKAAHFHHAAINFPPPPFIGKQSVHLSANHSNPIKLNDLQPAPLALYPVFPDSITQFYPSSQTTNVEIVQHPDPNLQKLQALTAVDKWRNQALSKLEEKDLAAAVDLILKALKIVPYNGELWLFLATIYYNNQEFTNAFNCCANAYQLCPHDVKASLLFAYICYNKKDFEKAIEFYDDAYRHNSDNTELDICILAGLGLCYVALGKKLHLAKKYFKDVLDWDPANEKACFGFGKFYQHLNKPQKALHYFSKITQGKFYEHALDGIEWAQRKLAHP